MPEYIVNTDQGKFRVRLDREPASQEELMSLVQQQLQGGVPSTPATPTATSPSPAEPTKESAIAVMVREALEGKQRFLSEPREDPLGISRLLGAMQVVGAPMAGLGQAVENLASPYLPEVPMPGGGTRNPAAALNFLTQIWGGPKAVGKAVGGTEKLLAPMVGKYGEQVSKVVGLEREFGIPTTAAQRTSSAPLSQAEAIPTRFPLGVQPVQQMGQRQEAASRVAVEKIGQSISPERLTPVQAGELLKKQYAVASEKARKAASDAYDAVKTAIPPEATFETPSLLKAAREIHREATLAKGVIKTKPEGIAAKIEAAVKPNTTKLPSNIAEYADDVPSELLKTIQSKYGALDNPNRMMTFEGMDLLRKDLRDMLQKATGDNEKRQIRRLIDGLTDDMRQTSTQFPEAFKLLEDADQKFAQDVAPYFTKGKFPRVLSEQDASQIAERLIWANRSHPENIELVKRALDNPQEFNKIVGSWWHDMFQRSIDPKTEIFSTQRWLTNWNRFSPEVKESLLGSENAAKAERLGDLFELMGRAQTMGVNPSQTARGILGASQAGLGIKIAGDLIVGNVPAAIKDGVLFITPYGLGKVLMSPRGIDWLSVGLQLPPGTRESVEVMTRIVGLANSMPEKYKRLLLGSEQISLDEKIMGALGQQDPYERQPPKR